jgi:hypothetical protein
MDGGVSVEVSKGIVGRLTCYMPRGRAKEVLKRCSHEGCPEKCMVETSLEE